MLVHQFDQLEDWGNGRPWAPCAVGQYSRHAVVWPYRNPCKGNFVRTRRSRTAALADTLPRATARAISRRPDCVSVCL